MSRITDLAAVLGVLSKVASKNAALRQVASDQKWKTSSIMRDVGSERQTYDTFRSEDAAQKSEEPFKADLRTEFDAQAAQTDDLSFQKSSEESIAKTPEALHSQSATADPSTTPVEKVEPIAQNEVDDEIFLLRANRRVPSLTPKSASDSRLKRKFRENSDSLRPSQADRFDVRSSGAIQELRKEQAKWRPQTAIDTHIVAGEESQSRQTEKTEKNNADVLEQQSAGQSTQRKATADLVEQIATEKESAAESPREESREEIRKLSSSAVPSSRFSRLYHYGTLGASLGFNAFSDSAKRLLNGPSATAGSGFLSERNTDLLVRKLSRMRGAALKLGQMISFQDEQLPGPIREVLQRVQDSADYMPASQLNKVMSGEFGSDWRNLFAEFNDVPIAAASIGQVHKARLPDGRRVAVKIQYPGVASSISSDLRNLSLLLTASRLLPKGLYLDKTIENARTELSWECDYIREAENTKRFKQLVGNDQVFTIPDVIDECSGKQVITTEFLDGVGIAKSQTYSQELRDFLGSQIMRLCLRELAEFRFMQTDPNWTNFLYNEKTNKIELLDFGACRSFDETFISKYCELLVAAAHGDRPKLQALSTDLGYLTGAESSAMVDAHLSSILTLGEPFSFSQTSEIYDFKDQTITERVKSFIPVMLRERLAPPPEETYSLHRRLSGHFLLCARMKSRIPCKAIFTDVMTKAGYMKPSI